MPMKYANILYITKDKAYLHSSLVLVLASVMYRHNFSRNFLRRGKKKCELAHRLPCEQTMVTLRKSCSVSRKRHIPD